MTDHFFDIRLLPDEEISSAVLISNLFGCLHQFLVANQRDDIGISFPGYIHNQRHRNGVFGDTLRIHGSASALAQVRQHSWHPGLLEYLNLVEISAVPDQVRQIMVRRKQVHSNPERERARLMRRKGIDAAQALALIPDHHAKRLELPFVVIQSTSSRQRFPLFILQNEAAEKVDGKFNAYGLSATATLPAW